MNEPRREDGPGRADRVTMRDGATLDIDDILRQPELARDHERDRRKGLVDLDALNRPEAPAGTLQRLLHRRDRAEAEHPGLDAGDAVGDEPGDRLDAAPLCPGFVA